MVATVLAYIPSPPVNGISLGPVRLHVYGLLIAAGVLVAVRVAQWRWSRIGGEPGTFATLAVWGVPGGLVGARAYSLATSWQVDTGGHIVRAFEIWRGGLGIWGGILVGVGTGVYGARRQGLPIAPLLDSVAPAFPLAQAVGRFGNYFNQELYGRPSGLPWAVKIDNPAPVAGYTLHPNETFQPTFLYEAIWDVIVFFLVIWLGRRFRIRRGYLLAAYAAFYTFGRFFTEYLRIDDAHRFWGLRLNDWTSIVVFVVAAAILLAFGRARPGDDRADTPMPATTGGADAPALGAPDGTGRADPAHPGDATALDGRSERSADVAAGRASPPEGGDPAP